MPFFSKRNEQSPVRFSPPKGDQACMEKGCSQHNAVMCNYIDRRRRRCTFALCPDHWGMVGGIVYCRRHAGTIAAVGKHPDPLGMPDIDNRAPSLVNWIAGQINGPVVAELQQLRHGEQQIVQQPGVLVAHDRNRRARYEHAWKIVETTGAIAAVTLFVHEDSPDLVQVRVGAGVVAEGIPPWIERRRLNIVVSPEVDKSQRELFYNFLMEHIHTALQEVHQLDARYR